MGTVADFDQPNLPGESDCLQGEMKILQAVLRKQDYRSVKLTKEAFMLTRPERIPNSKSYLTVESSPQRKDRMTHHMGYFQLGWTKHVKVLCREELEARRRKHLLG